MQISEHEYVCMYLAPRFTLNCYSNKFDCFSDPNQLMSFEYQLATAFFDWAEQSNPCGYPFDLEIQWPEETDSVSSVSGSLNKRIASCASVEFVLKYEVLNGEGLGFTLISTATQGSGE